ncbi:MAG: histidinol-phosphate transaminase [Cruoricaptor ignavus]|nr:histidinol-phosphate transaminase [Cruoricaptor ignavus]
MNFNLEILIRENIKKLSPYSSARDEFSGKEGIFLDANENPFGKLNRYPDPYQSQLKQRISELKNIPTSQIFLGNGSDEVIDLVFRIFAEPGKDKALIFTPTYGMYEVSANINNINLDKISLNEEFQIDINDELKQKLNDENLKIVFVCSPNNPTGNLIQQESVEFILKNFTGIVVIDEAYIDFSKTESWASQLQKYPNIVVMQTFSKYWGMAGLRVGMAFASEDIISLMNKVKPPYNISVLNQRKVFSQLKKTDKKKKQLEILLEGKNLLEQQLSELSFVEKVYPSDANFILVKVQNANQIYDTLIKKNIVVRNRSSVIDNCLRITIGTPKENAELIQNLKEFE